ncbi:hypothetical protein PHYSODRAFT_308225 [Phytophthora sojae]|uniref:Uncharacterized protein n=1 Tax=Phytophthora sojae (strain P6497) TaxID=1094619 RepID=G5AAF3_PHYSP|nr:hypothetical protein PHYSODRAFT_340653 [Phytophthora sojae]XP_009540034.1 hypothetical protein PHYSODRAFT_308225 [Phytophthora sojae]EGZ04538.1 hypothetical protein PHYSODRAFT_308225 [Phytophthora sojae]EGZ07582.1 hypothetical protein PHYSODRAFT_340653 [Phytophthora sojae]|eukprot:XP_009537148.1 hypothetical protein PHYSODRAFT_340653 [Phytophthora sojae]
MGRGHVAFPLPFPNLPRAHQVSLSTPAMQLINIVAVTVIATTLCFAPANASANVDAQKDPPTARKLYYPTPSPAANGAMKNTPTVRKLYYPTPSPVANGVQKDTPTARKL